jgi:antitoxin (DNA-binding transcriptional repressor) of toxin-antitoxin stability system
MTERISQRELRNDSGRIMRGLDEGRTYVITRRNEPVGELRPLRRRRFVDAQMTVEVFRGAPPVDLRRLREDLDVAAEQDAAPRA